MNWSFTTLDCGLDENTKLYVEKTWHSPDAPTSTLPSAPNDKYGRTYFYSSNKQLETNYDYAIVPFVKAFVSSEKYSDYPFSKYQVNQTTSITTGSAVISGLNGLCYVNNTIIEAGGGLPTDDELGKNLVTGLNSGSFSDSLKYAPWNDYSFNGWPWDIKGTYTTSIPIVQTSIGNITDISTIMNVHFNEGSAPSIDYDLSSTDIHNYQFPLMFTPFALTACANQNNDKNVYPCGIIVILGVKAVNKS